MKEFIPLGRRVSEGVCGGYLEERSRAEKFRCGIRSKKEAETVDRGKSIVDFIASNLNDLTERFGEAAARGVNGGKSSASIECSHIEQKENSVQSDKILDYWPRRND